MGGMPWIELDGAVNVRDLGGLATHNGSQTVTGRLLRGDNLQELSAADVAHLVDDVGLTTVVDLRSTAELEAEGPAPLQAVGSVRHVHLPVLPEQGSTTDMVADALLALALGAVGVRPDAIVADYMATGERTGPLLDRLRRSPTYADDINSKPQAGHAPRPGTMAALLEQVDARYGGAGRWLADHGFGEDGPGLLRAKLLSA